MGWYENKQMVPMCMTDVIWGLCELPVCWEGTHNEDRKLELKA